jgi:plasmid replication initiation protein
MFEYEQIKEGRKVCAINFIIKRNPKAGQAEEMREDPKLSFLVSRLTSHGMGEAKAREYVTSYPPEAIE